MTVQIQFVQVLVMDTWKIKKIKEIFYIKCWMSCRKVKNRQFIYDANTN
jgi:hypothetical protein